MTKKALLLFLLSTICHILPAQTGWWVFFTDKKGSTLDPFSYFAPEALERRALHGLPACDSTDFPVNENYVAAVSALATEAGYPSRWFNALEITADDRQIEKIKSLAFVHHVEKSFDSGWNFCSADDQPAKEKAYAKDVLRQVRALQGQLFFENGIDGKGIIIAILDVGFPGISDNDGFHHLTQNNLIKSTYDFLEKDENVDKGDEHGTLVLSCLAGIDDSSCIGMATGASYLLARITRPNGNQYNAESRWLAAMEWADKNGARIINNSGGPNELSYFPENMNGKTCIVSRAGNLAARKGILVVSAAGNYGDRGRPYILPPSDADSVLCVGAASMKKGSCLRDDYSSYGPTADFRVKPDVCAPGRVEVAMSYEGYSEDEGTSFSSPLTAGFAACVLQLNPETKCMDLFEAIRKSGSLYPYFDYSHGTGFPQASKFLQKKMVPADTSYTLKKDDFVVWVEMKNMEEVDEECTGGKLLYYNIQDKKGRIIEHSVVEACSRRITLVHARQKYEQQGFVLHIFCNGQYEQFEL
ncbi:MAG: peptidase S8 [Bacteroidetes bacterium]|nr:MAG: peptidase S8 [Bacteroidota bacterium]